MFNSGKDRYLNLGDFVDKDILGLFFKVENFLVNVYLDYVFGWNFLFCVILNLYGSVLDSFF